MSPESEEQGPPRLPGFSVTLPQFEGPFDLLLSLIARKRLDVTELALAARAGQPLVEHFSRLRIWQSRQQLIQQALTRLPVGKIQQLWQLMARLDDAQRRFDTEQAWLMLQTIALGFRDGTPLPLLEADPC